MRPYTRLRHSSFPSLYTLGAGYYTRIRRSLGSPEKNNTFEARDVQRIRALLDTAARLFQNAPSVVAHGDFDVTHIFYEHESYAGIIDFGEIRGTHSVYDLGHFAIENETLLPYLLDGYQEVTPLARDVARHILLTGLLIAARRVGLRLLQDRPVHQPDVAFVERHVLEITT